MHYQQQQFNDMNHELIKNGACLTKQFHLQISSFVLLHDSFYGLVILRDTFIAVEITNKK